MIIQLTREDLFKGGHSASYCPFHHAIKRACPNIEDFAVGTGITYLRDTKGAFDNPPEMENWIRSWDFIAWSAKDAPLISVDLPLEPFCSPTSPQSQVD